MSINRDLADWGQYKPQRKNYLINGSFDVWQRGLIITVSGSDYSTDRWWHRAPVNVGGTVSARQSSLTTEGLQPHQMRIIHTSATDDSSYIVQRVEGVRSTAQRTFTLSGWCDVPGTDVSIRLSVTQNFGSGGSADVSVVSGVTILDSGFAGAGGWAKFETTFTVPSVSGKTIGNGDYLQLVITYARDGAAALVDGSYRFTTIQLEEGTESTPFENRSFGEELSLCQRYYYRVDGNQGGTPGYRYGLAGALQMYGGLITFPTTMRDIPTVTDLTVLSFNNSSAAVWVTTKEDASIRVTVTASAKYRVVVNDTEFDAEL